MLKQKLKDFRKSDLYSKSLVKIKQYPFIYRSLKTIPNYIFNEPRTSMPLSLDNNQYIDEIVHKINMMKSNTLVILPPTNGNDWKGISVSTKQFFDDQKLFELDPDYNLIISSKNLANHIAKKFKKVIFSGLPESYFSLISEIKIINPKIEIDVMYHGSFTQFSNPYDLKMFQHMLVFLNLGNIQKVGCFKQDVAEYLTLLGYSGKVLQNKTDVPILKQGKKTPETDNVHIGLMSNHGWIKNIHNQLIAASLIDNSLIHVQEENGLFSSHANLISHGHMDHDSFIIMLDLLDIYLHISFSEASPVTPLEAYSRGLPCLVQSGTNFFEENSLLANYLYIDKLDDTQYIKEKMIAVLQNYETVSNACLNFMQKRNLNAEELFEDFLHG